MACIYLTPLPILSHLALKGIALPKKISPYLCAFLRQGLMVSLIIIHLNNGS